MFTNPTLSLGTHILKAIYFKVNTHTHTHLKFPGLFKTLALKSASVMFEPGTLIAKGVGIWSKWYTTNVWPLGCCWGTMEAGWEWGGAIWLYSTIGEGPMCCCWCCCCLFDLLGAAMGLLWTLWKWSITHQTFLKTSSQPIGLHIKPWGFGMLYEVKTVVT